MKYNMKVITKIIFVFSTLSFLFTACAKEYTKEDVEKYVKESIGVKHFEVSDNFDSVEGEDGYIDNKWTVKVLDDSNITFSVLDDFYWGMESVGNSLEDDYNDCVLEHFAKDYEFSNLKLEIEREEIVSRKISGSFKNKKELEKLFKELKEFLKFVSEENYDIEVMVEFKYENPIMNSDIYEIEDLEYSGWFYSGDTDDEYSEKLSGVVKEYLTTCITNQFKENLEDFTEKEIKEVVDDSEYRIGILRQGDENIAYAYYEDLLADYYKINFATLYEILRREGYEVSGDSYHYCFYDKSGDKYEISYDFYDKSRKEYETVVSSEGYDIHYNGKGYYYIKNGEIISMVYGDNPSFQEEEINELIGLNLKIGNEKPQKQ